MTMHHLPNFEFYEEGQQIRRSIKSVKSNIVEGYGRRRYKGEFLKFLTYALASNDETIDHLRNLMETQSLKNKELYTNLFLKLDKLGRKLNSMIKAIERNHNSYN
jgi:four helix bundle protein